MTSKTRRSIQTTTMTTTNSMLHRILVLVATTATIAEAFHSTLSTSSCHPTKPVATFTTLQMTESNKEDDDENLYPSYFSKDDQTILQERLYALHLEILEEEMIRPPNVHLNPIEVVKAILNGLYNSYDPLPDSGFRLLLHSSTSKWRNEIFKSLGVPIDSTAVDKKTNISNSKTTLNNKKKRKQKPIDYEVVASALGSSMGRPKNQFAILVGEDNNDDEDGQSKQQQQEYVLDFSASESQLLDFGDGTCWVECRLRDKTTNELLVLTGWDLIQREEDNAWLIDWIYWQDFREEFYPGITGRQEWLVNNVKE